MANFLIKFEKIIIMKKIYCVLVLISLSNSIVAQNNQNSSHPKTEFAASISLVHTKIVNRDFLGFNFDAKFYVKPKWAMGLNLTFVNKNVAQDFNYYVERPTVNFFEVSFLNHFDIYKSHRYRIGFTLANGYGTATLADRAYTEQTDEGFEVPITIARNHFYVLQAGVEAAVRLNKLKSSNHFDYYLKTDIKHRKTFGNTTFGTSNDFKGMYIGLGVLFVGNFY